MKARTKAFLTIHEAEKLTITVVTDNYYDSLRQDTEVATRYRTTPGASMHAEHGLAFFVEVATGGIVSRFMFDYGVDAKGVLNNMNLLGIDFASTDALGLSHGHFDHWGGLAGILELNASSLRKEIPFYAGTDVFAHRFSVRPPGVLTDIGMLDRGEIEAAGRVRIVEVGAPVEIVPGACLSGPIERVTSYEHISSHLLVQRGGELQQDQFQGEQAVVFAVKDKGLVVLSGCAHRGIVNTVKHAQKITGLSRLHAVLGGFHLINSDSEAIRRTVAEIKTLAPDYIVPMHCTGFEATNLFREEMAGKFILNTAGTRYVFGE